MAQPKRAKAGVAKAGTCASRKTTAAKASKATQKARKAEPERTPVQEEALARSWKGALRRDLPDLMTACGDSGEQGPLQETVGALEAIAVEFVRDVVAQAFTVRRFLLVASGAT